MVKWKEEQFRQIKESELSRRLAASANVWLSTFFGNKVKEDDYYELAGPPQPGEVPGLGRYSGAGVVWPGAGDCGGEEVLPLGVEFPEAFRVRRGFDVVIGNCHTTSYLK